MTYNRTVVIANMLSDYCTTISSFTTAVMFCVLKLFFVSVLFVLIAL